jgi:porin
MGLARGLQARHLQSGTGVGERTQWRIRWYIGQTAILSAACESGDCWVGDAKTSEYSYFLAGGGVYQGVFPTRDKDFVSFSVAYVRTNPRLTTFQEERNSIVPGAVGVQTFESIAEIDYNVQIAPWISVRPNLQYVINPAGTGKIHNGLVLGLFTSVTF